MFNRTIQMLEQSKSDARAFSYYATLSTQIFFLLYYTFAIALSIGFRGIYITMLSLTMAAFLFFMLTETPSGVKDIKMRRIIRTCVRYAKYCVHIVAISMNLYLFYTQAKVVTPITLILFILAILALLIQAAGEIIGFLARRYFEELLAAALADTELLRSVLDKAQNGASIIQETKDKFSALTTRAAQAAIGLKDRISSFIKSKAEDPIVNLKVKDQKQKEENESEAEKNAAQTDVQEKEDAPVPQYEGNTIILKVQDRTQEEKS